jgi:hypothetical protein
MAVGSSADSRPPRAWRTSSQPDPGALGQPQRELRLCSEHDEQATDSSGILSFAHARLSRRVDAVERAVDAGEPRVMSVRWASARICSFCLRSARSIWRGSMRVAPPSVRFAQRGAVARELGEAGGKKLGAAAERARGIARRDQPATDAHRGGDAEREQRCSSQNSTVRNTIRNTSPKPSKAPPPPC